MNSAQSDSLLGMQLDEYRLDELLGRGGMARVYRALDVRLNRYAAIKVIDTPYRADAEYVRRFEREAQAIARLEHPNVVRLFRYGEVEGLLYMAMQYVQGATLAFVLDSYRMDGEYIPPDEALQICAEMGRALDYVHGMDIIHRDVKPSNILLAGDESTGSYHAVLTDFGLALLTQMGTRGEIFGTPHYIAPEQAISSAKAVPQSDLYSLGVILYEMFTGGLPFNAQDPLDIALLHMSTPPPAPREVRPELSPQVEQVILKALEKKPEDRYPTGQALHTALKQALSAGQAQAMPSRLSIPQRVSEGLSARPLPPLPAAVTPKTPVKAEPGVPAGSADTGTENQWAAVQEEVIPNAAVDGDISLPAPVLEAENQPVNAEPAKAPARKILPTVRMADATPIRGREAAAEGGTSQPSNQGFPGKPADGPADGPAVKPQASKKSMRGWFIGAAVAAILLTACMLFSAWALYQRMTAGIEPGGIAGVSATSTVGGIFEETPADPTAPTQAEVPFPQAATATTGVYTYALVLGRCADNTCLVIKNQGKYPVLMETLEITGKNGSIEGSEWGTGLFLPGACLRAVSNEEQVNELPEGFKCSSVVGDTLIRKGKSTFWKDSFSVAFMGTNAGECKKNQTSCSFEVKK